MSIKNISMKRCCSFNSLILHHLELLTIKYRNVAKLSKSLRLLVPRPQLKLCGKIHIHKNRRNLPQTAILDSGTQFYFNILIHLLFCFFTLSVEAFSIYKQNTHTHTHTHTHNNYSNTTGHFEWACIHNH